MVNISYINNFKIKMNKQYAKLIYKYLPTMFIEFTILKLTKGSHNNNLNKQQSICIKHY